MEKVDKVKKATSEQGGGGHGSLTEEIRTLEDRTIGYLKNIDKNTWDCLQNQRRVGMHEGPGFSPGRGHRGHRGGGGYGSRGGYGGGRGGNHLDYGGARDFRRDSGGGGGAARRPNSPEEYRSRSASNRSKSRSRSRLVEKSYFASSRRETCLILIHACSLRVARTRTCSFDLIE